MSASTLLHAAFLRVFGALFLLIGAFGTVLPALAERAGVDRVDLHPIELTLLVMAIGAFFLLPWWLPTGLRSPSVPADFVWAGVVAVAGHISAGIVLSGQRVLLGEPLFGLGAAYGIWAILLLGYAATVWWVLQEDRSDRARPEEPIFDPEDEDEAGPEQAEPRDARTILAIHHAVLAIGGIAGLMVAAGILRLLQVEPLLFERLGQGGPTWPVRLVAAAGVIAGLSLFVAQSIPRRVRQPARARDLPAVAGWLLLIGAPAPLAFVTIPAGLPALADPAAHLAKLETNAALLSLLPGTTVAAILGLCTAVLLVATSVISVATDPDRRARRAEVAGRGAERRAAPRPVPLPAALRPTPAPIRWAKGLVRLLDWVALRALGAGLLGAAYLIWLALEAERPDAVAALTWEQDPFHALIFHAAFGLILSVPVLLPVSVLAPTGLFKALIKAVLVVAAALMLLPALEPLAALAPAGTLPPELVAQAPFALQVVAGASVTLALVTGVAMLFSRRTKLDYMGRPVVELTQEELRALRSARMGANA
jgi:hypothetical protein